MVIYYHLGLVSAGSVEDEVETDVVYRTGYYSEGKIVYLLYGN